MSPLDHGAPASPREWREGRAATPPPARFRGVEFLYASTAVVVLVVLVIALLASSFPGVGDPDAVCDAPGAPGCTPGSTWTFMAVVLGGPLAALLLALAVICHIGRALLERSSRQRR